MVLKSKHAKWQTGTIMRGVLKMSNIQRIPSLTGKSKWLLRDLVFISQINGNPT